MESEEISYWHWLFRGSGGKPGYRRLINKWLLFHLLIGSLVSLAVSDALASAANTVLLPLAGIFIGLSFAWVGNAQALLQSAEIKKLSHYHAGGYREYVFVFQMAVLTILATLILWGLAGLRVFDAAWPTIAHPKVYFIVKVILFCLASMSIRECWHVVMGAQMLLLVQNKITNSGGKDRDEERQ